MNGMDFPYVFTIDPSGVDTAVRAFSMHFSGALGVVKSGLNAFIGSVHGLLAVLPWWALPALVFTVVWRTQKRLFRAALYAGLLILIGCAGFWSLMNETLALILSSVILSLLIGFPVGLCIAADDRADRLTRPLWDTMQTMPVFVYLIPAVIFFGLGKAPAVIATTIYAVVPIIRLTNLGIRGVDKEVVEAASAFGSTPLQALFKVRIPQALPTIMAGVNQTLMMAMSMVVTCSMIGASGLGMEVLIGVSRIEMGRGLLAGICVVVVAIVLDRLTQGMARRES